MCRNYYYRNVPVRERISEMQDTIGNPAASPKLHPEKKQSLKKTMDSYFQATSEILTLFDKLEEMHNSWLNSDNDFVSFNIYHFDQELYDYGLIGAGNFIASLSRVIMTDESWNAEYHASYLMRVLASREGHLRALAERIRHFIEDSLKKKEIILKGIY